MARAFSKSFSEIRRSLPAKDRDGISSYVYFAATWPGYHGNAETIPEDARERELSVHLQLLDICLPDYFRGTSRDCVAIPLQRFSAGTLADAITAELDNLFF